MRIGRKIEAQQQRTAGDRRSGVAGKHIALVAADLSSGGGVNKVICDLAQLLSDRLGADVTILEARSCGQPAYALSPGVRLETHPRRGVLSYLRLLWRLRRTRPAFVVGFWAQDNILLTVAFLFSSTRVIVMEHASWHLHSRAIRALRRLVYPLALRVLVLNPSDLRHYAAFLDNVRLLPNAVTAGGSSNGPRDKLIIAIGHLDPLKNFSDAVAAMAKSGLEQDGWSLAIVGSGSEEEKLLNLIKELKLGRTTIHAPTADLSARYSRASLLLLTSRSESFSLVLAEAMVAGVVPIAYATDGPSFILEEFPDHLVAIGDVDALAERLRHFAANPPEPQLRSSLHQSIEERFAPSQIAKKWQSLLSELSA